MNTIRVLTADDVRSAVGMKEAISLMREAFAELTSGKAVVPQRLSLEMPEDKSLALFMPAYSPSKKRYGAKIVSLSDNNPSKGLPFIHGLVMLFDSDTGIPLALMNAESITALRTGAASGLATDLLARKDAETVVILGTGIQARTQLEGVAAVRRLKKAYVYGIVKKESEEFSREMGKKLGLLVSVAADPGIVAEADIICTATTSAVPVFRDSDLKPGVHINGIGSYKPTTREVPSDTIKRAKVVVDSRGAYLKEAGDLIIPMNEGIITRNHVHAELGEIVSGSKAARTTQQEITVFKSVGNAVQDLAVASRVLDVAEKDGLGNTVPM
jgi:ornithine cyclodeaminase/alanine dehydrogenase-like protein (mu-crystallin family)